MKIITLFILITFSLKSLSQSYSFKEIEITVDSIYLSQVGEERFHSDWNQTDLEVRYLYKNWLGIERVDYLNPNKFDKPTKGKLVEAWLSFEFNIHFEKCPEMDPIPFFTSVTLLPCKVLDSSDNDLGLSQIPNDYWNNKPCKVLDSLEITRVADTITFQKGIDKLNYALQYNSVNQNYVWEISNLLYDGKRDTLIDPKPKKISFKKTWEIVILNAETGKIIQKRIVSFPQGHWL